MIGEVDTYKNTGAPLQRRDSAPQLNHPTLKTLGVKDLKSTVANEVTDLVVDDEQLIQQLFERGPRSVEQVF